MDAESYVLAKKYAKNYADTGLATKASQTDLTTLSGTVSGHTTQLAEIAQTVAALDTTAIAEKTGYGVVSGLGVTPQGTPNMSVAIAAGIAYVPSGTRYTPSAVASQAINAAHVTYPRIDIIYLSSAGAITYLAGTASSTPAAPATPAGGLLLAEIYVAASVTTITKANITPRKQDFVAEDWRLISSVTLASEVSAVDITVDSNGYAFKIKKLRVDFLPMIGGTGNTAGTGLLYINAGNGLTLDVSATYLDVPAAAASKYGWVQGEVRDGKWYSDSVFNANLLYGGNRQSQALGVDPRTTYIRGVRLSALAKLWGVGSIMNVWGIDA